jgi:hypothetical protein
MALSSCALLTARSHARACWLGYAVCVNYMIALRLGPVELGVLRLQPGARPATDVPRADPIRNDAFEPQTAGVPNSKNVRFGVASAVPRYW